MRGTLGYISKEAFYRPVYSGWVDDAVRFCCDESETKTHESCGAIFKASACSLEASSAIHRPSFVERKQYENSSIYRQVKFWAPITAN